MNRSVKGIAIIAGAMVAAGILLTGIGFLLGGNQPIYLDSKGIHVGVREGGKVGDDRLVSFSHDVDSFSNISVDLDYYDVDLVPGDRFAVQGAYLSREGEPVIKVENDTLKIEDGRHVGVNVSIDLPGLISYKKQPNITIYYPETTKLKHVAIDCDLSDLAFENLTAEQAEFDLEFGKLDLSGITANRIAVEMNSGECSLKGIKAAEKLDISNEFGKISLENAETKNLKLEADSGDVTLTDMTFDTGDLTLDLGKLTARGIVSNGMKVESSKGEVNVAGKLTGLTDITSDMGKVTVNPGASKDQFSYELNADMGSVTVGGEKMSGNSVVANTSAANILKIKTSMGEIRVDFE